MAIQPAVVVGQSLGGLTALSPATRRPELIRGVVPVKASPGEGSEGVEDTVSATTAALASWPVPLASRDDAEAFFGAWFGQGLAVEAWTTSLQEGADRWRPMVEPLPRAQLVEITDAAHDLHLDRPEAWREALNEFLDSLDGP